MYVCVPSAFESEGPPLQLAGFVLIMYQKAGTNELLFTASGRQTSKYN
jgi:hypothetical protein